MRNALIIARREYLSFLTQPVAYVAMAVFLVIMGVVFFYVEDFFGIDQASMRAFFEWGPIVFILFLPALSMRLIAEERRTGTLELLITLPVRAIEVAAGKLIGAWLFLLTTLAFTLAYPLVVSDLGDPDMGMILGGYLGLALVGLAYLGLGLMASSWTRNQIVALILGSLFCSIFYFIDSMVGAFATEAQPVVSYFSFKTHFANVARGVIDSRDVIFYLSVTVVTLMVASYNLESRKWK
jgi:ABC-2 type transport system permease protein